MSEAVDLAIRSLVSVGDEVLIPEPSYVSYLPVSDLAYAKSVSLTTTAENEFRLTRQELAARVTPQSKLLVLPYPNNPTGGIMRREDLVDLVDVIIDNDLIVVSDEIYSELTMPGTRVYRFSARDAGPHCGSQRIFQGFRYDRLENRVRMWSCGYHRCYE